jgi:hypothetical protein
MTKWVNSKVQDDGLNYLKTNCNKIALISAYSANDSYATVTANILAEATMSSSDFTLAGAAGAARTCTTAAGKQDAAANAGGGGANMHIAFLNTNGSEVLWVTDETSDQTITINNPITFPSLVYTSNQPT